MPTLDFLTGFNHRTAVAAGAVFGSGTVSIDTATVRYIGGSSLKALASASTSRFDVALGVTSAVGVAVVYVNFAVLPTSNTPIVALVDIANIGAGIAYDVASGQLGFYDGALGVDPPAVSNVGGPVIATGVWYRIDLRSNVSANPWVVSASIAVGDGAATALTGITYAEAATSIRNLTFMYAAVSRTFTAYITDVAFSSQSADYPIGPIQVNGYSPNSVGTHNLDASTSAFFFKEVSAVDTALTNIETTSYQTIDDIPLDLDVDGIVIKPTTTFNTISRIGTPTSAAATTVTIPTGHASGDLITMFVYRSASSSAPTIPAGWTQLGTTTQTGGTKGWWGLYYKIAASSAETSGTWTSATALECVVYRNAIAPVAGDATLTSGVSTTMTYGARTIANTTHDWLEALALTASSNASTTPTGLSVPTGYTEIATRGIYDSNGIRGTNWSALNQTITSQAWGTVTLNIRASSTVTQPTNTWYSEYGFVGESIITSAPLAVRALVAQNLDTAVATTWAAKLYDQAQGTNVEDVSNSSISSVGKVYVGKTFSQRPNSGGAWTLAALNALRLHFGYTNAASGDPRLEAAMLEAAFVPAAGATAYTESATIGSVTSVSSAPSSTDVAAYADSQTIATVTALSAIDIAAYVDAQTVPGTTSLSATELHEIPDAATVSSITSLASSDIAAYVDASTTSTVTTPSAVEVREIPDSATISTTTSITYTEVAAYVDANTPSGTTTPSASETHEIPDASTISGTTTITTTDLAAYVDAATSSGTTTPSSSDVSAYTDSTTSSGITSVSATDISADVESSTISGTTTPISVDIYLAVDSSTISGNTTPSSTDTEQSVDSSTATSVTTPSSAEIHEIRDSSTVSGTSTITTLDVAAYVDTSTTAGVTSVISAELHETSDAATISTKTQPTGSDNAVYIDADTPSSGTSINSTDASAVSESATITTLTSLTSSDILAAVDSNTVSGSTSLSAIDVAAYVDQSTSTSVTTPSSSELHEIPDSSTIATITSVAANDVAAFIDQSTNSSVTTITSTENGFSDANSISSTTTPSATDVASYVDQSTPSVVTVASATESHEIPDSSTIASTTVPLSLDQADYVDNATPTSETVVASSESQGAGQADSGTATGQTSVSYVEQASYTDQSMVSQTSSVQSTDLASYADSSTISIITTLNATEQSSDNDVNTVSGVTSVSYAEVASYTDANAAIARGITTPISSDIAAYSDSNSATSTTNVISTEFAGSSIFDNKTIAGVTSLTYTETTQYVETPSVVNSSSSATSTEITEFADTSTPRTATIPSADEFETFTNHEAATVTSITYVLSYEIGAFIRTELIARLVGKTWLATATSKWVSISFKNWITERFEERFQTNERARWIATILGQ